MDNFKVKNKTNDDHINGHKEKPSSTDKHPLVDKKSPPVKSADKNLQQQTLTKKNINSKNSEQNIVAIIVGKSAMPTTVLLVIITCISGFYLDESKFTPVVGMIAPVIMALIMVIREASLGKEDNLALLNNDSEREERIQQFKYDKDVQLMQIQIQQKMKEQELQEQARQFDIYHASTREFLALIKDTNDKLSSHFEKIKSTELSIGDTSIKISDDGTRINNSTANI